MSDYSTLLYEHPAEGVVRIVMNRPHVRNAQDLDMTYELHAAFDRAMVDAAVKVVILAGADPHFSSGHDLRSKQTKKIGVDYPARSTWGGFDEPAIHARHAREQEIYLQATRRWRNLEKPTIAEVQGRCIAGGLMLAWACDLIVASEDATFCDPVVAMGVCGVEWFVHPWELGARKAKEMLWTAGTWTAREAQSFGMVNRVVPREELAGAALGLASVIASKPAFAVRTTKAAVNGTLDAMGQSNAVDQAFALHQLCHAHNLVEFGSILDPSGIPASIAKSSGKA